MRFHRSFAIGQNFSRPIGRKKETQIARSLGSLLHSYSTILCHRTAKKLVKAQKQDENFIKNYENSESKTKKHEQNLENNFFVHWASFDCK